VASLAVAGFVLSLAVGHFLMPHGSGNADEVVYRFQAEMYREGRLVLPDDGRAFRPWMSGAVDGERFMVYPPGWPSVLAIGLMATGSADLTVAVVVALLAPAAYWLVRELTGDRRAAVVAGVALLASPFVVVHSGTWLTYLPALLCAFVAVAAALRAVRTARARWFVVAGLALGLYVSIRPVDAVLLAILVGAFAVLSLRRRPRLVLSGLGWAALGALPFAALTLVYNHRVTGAATRFPMQVAGGNNSFGFGARNIAEGTPVLVATFGEVLRATVLNLVELLQWIPGAWLGAPLAALGIWVLWRDHRGPVVLLVATGLVFPLTYLFFWGTLNAAVGRDVFGPFYYGPAWVPTVSFLAVGVIWLWDRRSALAPAPRALVAGGLLVLALAGTAFALRSPLEVFTTHTERADDQLAAIAAAPDGSLVVLPMAFDGPWILQPWNLYANTPALDGRVVFAADDGDGVIDALGRFGDRPAFALLAPEGPGNGGALALEELSATSASSMSVVVAVGVGPDPTWAYAASRAGGLRCRVVPDATGVATVRWRLDAGAVAAVDGCAGPVEPTPGTPPGQRACAFGAVTEASSGAVDLREERFWCRTAPDGDTVVVTPGEPRRGVLGADGAVAWTGIGRADAEAGLRVAVAPTVEPSGFGRVVVGGRGGIVPTSPPWSSPTSPP
jgi:hypothetical protein